jgi:CHAT domain-containing protein
VVSSYTPTLTALHRLLTTSLEGSVDTRAYTKPRMLLIGQSLTDTGNLPELSNTQLEIDCVRSLIISNALINSSVARGMTVSDALEGAMNADILHLACHGHQDQNSPLDSGFDLKDGRLKLSKLMRMNMPNAQLAYLSACESAGMDESRPDEGLNLAGGMIFAGFKSVIATLW